MCMRAIPKRRKKERREEEGKRGGREKDVKFDAGDRDRDREEKRTRKGTGPGERERKTVVQRRSLGTGGGIAKEGEEGEESGEIERREPWE